jgi:hypothetical protein
MVTYRDIYIDQGATYVQQLTLLDEYKQPLNLLNYDVQARLSRSNYTSEFISIDVLSNDPANGVIELSLSSDITATLNKNKYMYEMVAIDTVNNVTRLMEGLAVINPGIGLPVNKYSIS